MQTARRLLLTAAPVAAMLSLLGLPVRAEQRRIYAPAGMAIGGYDPVAYFAQGAAVQGEARYMLKWRGAMWVFASAANLEAFEMNPAAYMPQYGGYCALSVSLGGRSDAEPQVWVIVNGRLYLFHNAQAMSIWQQNIPEHVSQADGNWQALSGK